MASKAKPKRAVAKKAAKKVASKLVKKTTAANRPAKAARKAVKKAVKKIAKPAPKALASRPAKPSPPGPDRVTGCAPGSQQFIPSLVVRNVEDAIRFYEQAFGFKLDFTMPGPDGNTAHVQMTFWGGRIMFSPEGAFGATNRTPATLGVEAALQVYAYCPDVDALAARAAAAGATILMPPADMFWGDRMLHLEDPDGYRWAFATNVRNFDPAMTDPRNPH